MCIPLRFPAWARPVVVLLGSLCLASPAAIDVRTELQFPDLPGLVTLRCDFHTHTVFSDGSVWPTVRIEEAWRDGLDVIAISDHIEYIPKVKDIPVKFGRSAEIARASAERLGLLVVSAAEITRGEPPGHFNALFLTNVAALDVPDYRDAVRNAVNQGAFVFWNHPGWKQPEGKSVWYEEQGDLHRLGLLHGLEVVNGTAYDPIAHQWCVEKHLALIGNSDIHGPVGYEYNQSPDGMRPLTLVFAKERTMPALREAMLQCQTAVVSKNRLFGDRRFLEPLFQRSIEIVNPEIQIHGKGSALVQIRNRSPLNYEIRLAPRLPELDVPSRVELPAGKVALLEAACVSDRVRGDQEIVLACRVENLFVEPGKKLRTGLRLRVRYVP